MYDLTFATDSWNKFAAFSQYICSRSHSYKPNRQHSKLYTFKLEIYRAQLITIYEMSIIPPVSLSLPAPLTIISRSRWAILFYCFDLLVLSSLWNRLEQATMGRQNSDGSYALGNLVGIWRSLGDIINFELALVWAL